MFHFQCTGRNPSCLDCLACRKSWSCSLKGDNHYWCLVWGQIHHVWMGLSVHLDGSPKMYGFCRGSSCPHSRLPRTQPIWVTAQQRQWPQLSALGVRRVLIPALHDALAQKRWERQTGRRTIRSTSRSWQAHFLFIWWYHGSSSQAFTIFKPYSCVFSLLIFTRTLGNRIDSFLTHGRPVIYLARVIQTDWGKGASFH